MKKLLISIVLLVCTTGIYAQFEKNKWFVNPSLTGLDLSYNKNSKVHFGLEVKGGAFLIDNLALLMTVGGDYGKHQTDVSKLGVGCRYYFDSVGIYGGIDLNYKHCSDSGSGSNDDFGTGLEVGYAYFLSRTVTIEPAVYYDLSFSEPKDWSRFGVKVGFGLYF